MNSMNKPQTEVSVGELVLLSPAIDEEGIESAACGVQCDCNAKW